MELFNIKDGVITNKYSRSQYSVIRDELAKRTSDESGDYYVNGLSVRVREHLEIGNNGGYLASANGGNSSLLAVGVEPGVAYVKGYEVNKLTTEYIDVDKSLDFEEINSQISTSSYGNYITIKEIVGSAAHDEGTTISLYDTAQNRITDGKWSSSAQTGSPIGLAKVKCIEYDTGTLGTANATMLLYLYDVSMNGSNTFSDVKSVYINNSTSADFGADVVLTSNNAVLQEVSSSILLYPIGSSVKTIRDTSGNPDTTFTFKRTENISISSGGTFTLSLSIPNEIYPYGTNISGLVDADRRQITLSVNEDINVALTGTVTGSISTNTLTGSSTKFEFLNVGDKIEIAGIANTFTIASITSNTAMTLTSNLPSNATTATFYKVYKTGDLIDLTTKGLDAGVERTITSTPTTLTFNLRETYGSTKSATVTYRVARTSAREIKKLLRPDRFVKINCATAGTTGPFSLGFSDVYRIKEIRKQSSNFTSNTEGTLVTDSYLFDDGQDDEFYGISKITPKPSESLSASDNLLIRLDYFEPDYTLGVGYFSVDSYPIDDANTSSTTIKTEQIPLYVSPYSGALFDLRNCLDFRSVKTKTANDSTTVSGASINPSADSNFNIPTNGLRLPYPSSQVIYDYSYYLARIDLITVNQDNVYSRYRGVPAIKPATPVTPPNEMALASVLIAPYPSLSPFYATEIKRKDLGCIVSKKTNIRFTMRDIGVLQNRIQNLEYYTVLNSLEKQAIDYKVLDQTGLDRFKNGIFVDSFVNHELGDTENIDYKISIDPVEKVIRPFYRMDSLYYGYVSGTNITINNDLVTLPYTEELLSEQLNATTSRNVEASVYKFVGNLYLNPETDVWVDSQQLPDNAIDLYDATVRSIKNDLKLGMNWNAWQADVVGYTLENASTGQVIASWTDPTKTDIYKQQAFHLSRRVTAGNADRNLIAQEFIKKTSTNIVETNVNYRTGTEVEIRAGEKIQFGDKVVDASLIPYIRPQTIELNAKGLKANTRFYTFFDGENMSDYVTPTNSNYEIVLGSDPLGSKLTSDANGEVYALLTLPSSGKKFTVGSKEVVLTDSPTNDQDATSKASKFFLAQGLALQKQNDSLATYILDYNDVLEFGALSRTVQFNQPLGPSCSAYTFVAKAPEQEEGLFLTSVDVYFQSVHPTLGVWFEIRELDSSGGITRKQVPFSEVWYRSNEITVSDDASVPHNVKFSRPIFLYNDVEYAFVIHTEGLNPDTYLWVSRLGETDFTTNTKVTSRALSGTFYGTTNNRIWDIIPDVDLKCKFYRAKFDTTVTGVAILGNKPTELVVTENVSGSLNIAGETFVGSEQLTLSSITGGTIDVTDRIIGNTSGANGYVANITSTYNTTNTSVVGFTVGEEVSVTYANSVSKGVTATVSAKKRAQGKLGKYYSDFVSTKVDFTDSNGNFFVGDTMIGLISGHTLSVNAISKIDYSIVDFEPSYITFGKTTINYAMQPYSNTGVVGSYRETNFNENYNYKSMQAVFSRSYEIANFAGDRSNKIRASLSTITNFLSPVLDLRRTHSVYVKNLVNDDDTGEDGASGGNLINKYISRIVTLAEGQDAEDIKVLVTAYRPPNTDVVVYVKLLNNEDPDSVSSRPWIELEKVDDTIFSSLADEYDPVEFEFKIPESYMTGPNGEFQYLNSSNALFTGYKHFTIKVGLKSSVNSIVPRVADLRALALQM